MRIILQRVSRAQLEVDGRVLGRIGLGWVILVGIGPSDDELAIDQMVDRVVKLRAFEDSNGKMNLSAEDVRAEFLVVAQFTLYADLSRGRRPSFIRAASPPVAEPLVARFADRLRERGFTVATGRFGSVMNVELVNAGPVTIPLTTDGWV